jgi:pimeloyl-ACP methyl ester carboxylesterase
MPYITSSDGPKIWYDALGEGEPLFLIGGSSLVRRQWDFMVPFLQDRFRVILYDQRGAGLSERPSAGITAEKWVDDLKMILDEIGVRKTHLFSTSNGSLVAIRFAAKYPQTVQSLIHYGIYKFTDQYRKMSKIGETIIDQFGIGNNGLGGYFLSRMFGTPPLYEEWVARRFEENLSPEAWKAMHRALDVDLTEDLREIKTPQMILVGETGPLGKDTDYASGWREFKRFCPDTEFEVIRGSNGTFHVLTHPAEVARVVFGFLRKHGINAADGR